VFNSILKSPRTALAAVLGGAVYAFTGAIEATQDFGGTRNTIDSTGECLVTGGSAVALLLTCSAYRAIRGEDLPIFNTLAPICLLTWLVASIVIGVALKKTRAVAKPVAIGLPAIMLFTIPLSAFGGPLVTGAYWIAIGSLSMREEPVIAAA
jgi:hypothetical protein